MNKLFFLLASYDWSLPSEKLKPPGFNNDVILAVLFPQSSQNGYRQQNNQLKLMLI